MYKVASALVCLVAAVSAHYIQHEGPHHHEIEAQHQDVHSAHHVDYYAYPQYKFEYGVKDPHTGDHKSHKEERDGDVVKGEYTLDEADGTKRVVEYTADHKTGFNAVVKRVGHAFHPHVEYHFGHHEVEAHHGQEGHGQIEAHHGHEAQGHHQVETHHGHHEFAQSYANGNIFRLHHH